jgi:hypothetical protein
MLETQIDEPQEQTQVGVGLGLKRVLLTIVHYPHPQLIHNQNIAGVILDIIARIVVVI